MNIIFIIFCAVIVIGFIVLIHEGGHYLAARAFKVRVTEFMLGLPGPSIGFTKGGTRFGITAVPLGGYAKVCGMETGPMSPHLKPVLACVYERGTVLMEEVAAACGITDEEAYDALEELVEWGSIDGPTRADKHNTYRTPARAMTAQSVDKSVRESAGKTSQTAETAQTSQTALASHKARAGEPLSIADIDAFFASEYAVQYRSLPFWKRSVILLAGIAVNLLFAIIAFVLVYSVIGIDIVHPQTGEMAHMTLNPIQSIQAGFGAIVMTFESILGLFNPETAAQTVSNSTSIVGIAVMSADFFARGVADALFFMAIVSISIGLMNLLPIPPLDGGRFVVEIIQKVSRRDVPMKALGYISFAGMALFLCFFVFMLNQDIQRYIFGNW